MQPPLPIDSYLPKIFETVAQNQVTLLCASPGSGKTLRVPYALSQNAREKVIVLEPRRLAAKLAAERACFENQVSVGNEIGYWFRHDKKMNADTQTIYATEGTFLRWLESDLNLNNFKILILDEFHERHLETDLALALTLPLVKQNKLKLIVMSATMELNPLIQFFKKHELTVSSINIQAPPHPLEINYLENADPLLKKSLPQKVSSSIEKVLNRDGDILVFLPGIKEINETKELIEKSYDNIQCLILHGSLSLNEQQAIFSEGQFKRIILSTNLAESSVTIPNVRIVIDGTFHRETQYSPWTGINHLETVKSSQFSLIQRAGRANREASGFCLRLITKLEFDQRSQIPVPSLHREDLTEAIVLTKSFPHAPQWYEPPKPERWNEMTNDLVITGIIDGNDHLSPSILELRKVQAPVLYAKSILAGIKCSDSENSRLLNILASHLEEFRKKEIIERWKKTQRMSSRGEQCAEWALLQGLLPFVAFYKNDKLISFKGANLKIHPTSQHQFDPNHKWWLILEVDHFNRAIKLHPIEEEWLYEYDPFPFTEENIWSFNSERERFDLKVVTKLGKITCDEEDIKEIPKSKWGELRKLVIKKLEQNESKILEDQKFKRLIFALKDNDLSYAWEDLLHYCPDALTPSPNETKERIQDLLEYYLQEKIGQKIDEIYPLSIKNKDKNLKIIWDLDSPCLEAPIQFFFGLNTKLGYGKFAKPFVLKLLGPHGRPLQKTKDLDSFWMNTYKELSSELKRDYPRHYWSDKPKEDYPHLLKRHAESKKES
ncbi:MAG: hypothetical protein Fur0010_00990 [Bdellovibrio sp.]